MGPIASGVELATAYIQLIPSLQGAQREIQRQMGPIGQRTGQDFGRSFGRNSSSTGGSSFATGFETDSKKRFRGVGQRVGSGFGKAFAAAGGVLAAAGVANFLGDSLGEAREAQKVGALTEQTIKSTGGAAKVSAKQIGDLAGAISAKTGIDDEAIQSASNLLLTFTNLRNEAGKGNDIFNQTTKIATDMGAALGNEPKAAAIQLGKALNDPIKGVSALSRVGVTFTEQQKKTIKGFVEGGKTAEAQKVILQELSKEFGGAAEAQATAGDKAAVAFGNLKEQIGTALLPVVDRFAKFATTKVIPAISGIVDAFAYLFSGGEQGARGFAEILDNALGNTGRFIDPITSVTEALQGFFSGLSEVREEIRARLQPVFDKFGEFVQKNPDFVKAFAIALGVLVGAISAVTVATTLFSIALNSTGIPLVIIGIALLVAGLVVAYKRSESFRNIVDQVGATIARFGNYLKAVVLPAVIALAQNVATKLKPIFDQLAQTFVTRVLPTLQQVFAKIQQAMPAIQQIATFIARWIGTLIRLAATILGKVLPPLIRFYGLVFSKVVPVLATVIGFLIKVIGKIAGFGNSLLTAANNAKQFATKIGTVASSVVTKIQDTIGRVPDKIRGYIKDMVSAGKDFIGGLFDGIKSAATGAGGVVAGIAESVKNALVGGINDLIRQMNNAIPDKIGKGKLSINLPNNPIPELYKGTSNFQGGVALVGERGPELVTMPRGTRVDTAAATRRMAGGASAAAGFGGTTILRVGDREFVAYLEQIADSRVESASDMTAERSRATWYR